jgi:hypothetical protein
MNGIFNMKKFVVQEKSRGILLFAFNTEINEIKIDYVRIAEQAARLVHKVLDLPVTLITDQQITTEIFDQIVYVDNTLKNYKIGQPGAWRNGDRFRAYELSPYDETLLIDSDYLTLDQSLLKLFEQDFDYKIMAHNQTPNGPWADPIGTFGFNYQWATVILFRKTEKTKMLFDLVGRIQRNYTYYMKLYHIKYRSFRNDFAFTIANNILNGYEQNISQGILWPMMTFNNIVTSLDINDNLITVKEKDNAYVIPRQNIHVMDKEYLLSNNFNSFVDKICTE